MSNEEYITNQILEVMPELLVVLSRYPEDGYAKSAFVKLQLLKNLDGCYLLSKYAKSPDID